MSICSASLSLADLERLIACWLSVGVGDSAKFIQLISTSKIIALQSALKCHARSKVISAAAHLCTCCSIELAAASLPIVPACLDTYAASSQQSLHINMFNHRLLSANIVARALAVASPQTVAH